MWESWAAGVRTNFNHEIGFYDDRGIFEAGEDGSYDQQLRLDAYALVKTSENGALFLVVPWVFPRIGDSESGAIGSNISDIQVGYRHQVIAIGEYEELPSLALSGALLIPTGQPRQLGVAAHEVTGRDALALMAGASLEKTWMPVFVQLNLGASLLFNQIRTGNKTPAPIAPSFQVALASGVEIAENIVASLMSAWTYEMPAKWKTEAGAAASWRFTPHLTAQLSVNTNIFLNGSGLNWPANVSYGAGIRYGYF